MKLPIPFLKQKQEESDYYLSLIITDEKISAIILQEVAGALKKINSSEAFFNEGDHDFTVDALVNTADKAISRAEEVLPPDIQTHQTVFGVKDSWVEPETKKIKKEYLERLKKVCDALDLKPLGFMVTVEAVTHLMQDEEGAPLSALFAQVAKKTVTLSLLRGGKVLETVSSPQLESVPATVDKLLSLFSVPVLPARIVIFQSKADERTSQAFLHHHWSKSLPFLHVPQVTVLPENFDLRAVMNGAATQMGLRVSEPKHETLTKVTPNLKDEEALAVDEEAINDETPINDSETQEQEAALLAEEASDFGFVVDQDIDQAAQETKSAPSYLHESSIAEPDDELENERALRSSRAGSKGRNPLAEIRMPSFSGVFNKFSGNKSSLKIIIPVAAVILLVVGISLFYFYGTKAHVVLTLTPNMVDQKNTVTFSVDGSNDFPNNMIAAKSVSTSINAQVSTPATGKKDVGDKAKGTVTIYNTSSSTVSLSSGTQLTASNGQVFLLNNDVKVASSSGDIFSGTKPGTTDASVAAKDLGTDGNEPTGTKFAVSGSSSIAAKNDNAFSGGSKKTVTVVSNEDLATLRSNIVKSVQGDAQKKLTSQASGDEAVLPIVSDPSVQAQHFDKSLNDEAKQVSLNANVVFNGIAYTKSDLNDYAKTILKDKAPQGGNLADKTLNATVGSATLKTKNTATATVLLEAGILPNMDQQDIINNIKDKSVGDAKNTLSSLSQVQQADITFSPPIPLLPSLFPRLPHQISVEIKSQ
ncbi:MAG: hypothetical protein ACR2LN_00585 [Candidatus Levyibacteriota bacterium]